MAWNIRNIARKTGYSRFGTGEVKREGQREGQIETKLKGLPDKPGVYQFFDSEGTIIYVGKAKNLKKRVLSYFSKNRFENRKTEVLVKKVVDLSHIIVETEFDALLLENSLIKEHQPKFNIQLRDDKTYPWICIKNEPFPRVFPTRNVVKDGSQYFGPYASVKLMKSVLDIVSKLYKIRTCNYSLTPENIAEGKFRPCLEYHIGNCKAPCVGYQSQADYDQSIANIRNIIKGNVSEVVREMRKEMDAAALKLDFEAAQAIKAKIERLEDYQARSTVVNPSINDVDVISILSDEQSGYANYMRIVNGAVIQSHSLEMKKRLDESNEDLLISALLEMRGIFHSNSKEVFTSIPVSWEAETFHFHCPQRGEKLKLIELSLRNARFFMAEKHKQQEKIDPERHVKRILGQVQKDLRLEELPRHMECFDNSNFHGSYPVAACVVFKNAKPSKEDYRHFNIKTVEGPNDFASMEEVVYRRYKRLGDENQSLPQLVIIDGGKGQLSSAVTALKRLGLYGKIALVGIAKKLEEIYFPEDPLPLYIDKRSESLKIIQRMRNEAHRFGITHHRNKRSKGTFKSELLEIPGIGEKSAKDLLRAFYSIERIKTLDLEKLKTVLNASQAQAVLHYFATQNPK